MVLPIPLSAVISLGALRKNAPGSTAKRVLRMAHCDVHVTSPTELRENPESPGKNKLLWQKEALQRLNHVPSFARPCCTTVWEPFLVEEFVLTKKEPWR